MNTILILDNIRSVMNVGSLFRTANALGIQKIYLCGITPGPLDRFNRPRKDFAKVSLGADESIAWEHIESTLGLIQKLRTEGCYVVVVEQSENAVDYKSVDVVGKSSVAFVLGPEVEGMSPEVLKEVSVVAEIPMLGSKESLNVSVAGAVALYRILNI